MTKHAVWGLCLCCVISIAVCQEEAAPGLYEEKLAALTSDLSSLRYDYEAAVKARDEGSAALAAAVARAESVEAALKSWEDAYESVAAEKDASAAEVANLQAALKSWEDAYDSVAAEKDASTAKVANLQATIDQIQVQLSQAHIEKATALAEAASAKNLTCPETTLVPPWVNQYIAEAQAGGAELVKDLSKGDFASLKRLGSITLGHVTSTANTAADTVTKAVDVHLPGLKRQLSGHYDSAQGLYQKHVATSPVFQNARATASAVDAEVKKQLTSTFKSVPQLQQFLDPVSLQAITYAIFAATSLLVLLPVLLMLRPRRKLTTETVVKKKKKSKAPAGAINRV